ncbi:uncharacterized protein EAF02_006893 [Botrytis sinoallii]|uniref:uncharacterized protein n=1 Tax=Botrytis sinoallii TaxID=1463999 RepID=UPI0018FF5B24|nr:uncharacterized protein EAF02_006893 [Botrytis sinoallii]KAF7881002.1 hypothetical protein EAF02_006893 [Botrytis sinoallii]
MSQKVRIKDPNLQVQSWTRCKLPVEMPLPARVSKNYIEDLPEIWHESLTGLMYAPGFLRSRCARNVKNAEEVLFAIEWEDDASFKAFMKSPAYPLYLRGFGIRDSQTPDAMVSLFPSFDVCTFSPGGRVTVFIHSFKYPATEQNRHDVRDAQGLLISRRFGTLGVPCQHVWIRQPQMGDDRQLVEKGVVVQAWPNTEPPVIFEAVDQDENARDNLRKHVRRINPINMEEMTWHVAKVENEDEDEDQNEDEDGKDKNVNMMD